MNFDFMMECEIKDPKIKAAYDEIYKELVDAEAHYWSRSRAASCSGKQQNVSAVFTMIITRLVSRKVHC